MTQPPASLLRALLPVLLLCAPALAAAQGQVYDAGGGGGGGGGLPWVFVAFGIGALVAVFLVIMWLRRPPERPPFNKPRA